MAKHLIYLAAGSSRRFGSNKLLYSLAGKPLFLHGLTTLCQAASLRPDCTLTVVSRYPQILQTARELGARTVDIPDSVRGLSHTIQAALASLLPLAQTDFLLFVPADQPWLTVETVLHMLDAARPGVAGGTAAWEEQVGAPTLFSASLAPQLLALTGDQGGRAILKGLGSGCLSIPVGHPRELMDLDVPPDPMNLARSDTP